MSSDFSEGDHDRATAQRHGDAKKVHCVGTSATSLGSSG